MTDRQQTDRHRHGEVANKLKHRQTDRQTDRQREKTEADRQRQLNVRKRNLNIDRHTETYRQTYTVLTGKSGGN